MPSAGPSRLTDDLWLAAHDSVNGKSQIGEWLLGVGLATGLLAELIHGGFLELREGELFRTPAEAPADPALNALLIKMDAEEQHLPSAVQDDWDWPPRFDHAWGRRPPLAQGDFRHRRRGHQLGRWMSYLAYEGRAEDRVVDRLSRTGLVKRREHRRLLGGTTVSYVPYNSVAAATPASMISVAVRGRLGLDRSQLFLAGLFLATGLHHHALATLTPSERSMLADELKRGLDEMSRELLRAADAAVGEAAMR